MNAPAARMILPDWPRLMRVELAARYLGLGETKFRALGIASRQIGGAVVWDIRDLDRWADESDLLPADFVNPAAGIRRLKSRSQPIEVWTDAELALAIGHCTGPIRTALLLAAYTGQRRQDLVRLTWADYHGGTIRLRQSKTGEPLEIPCHPVLRQHLDSIRTGFGGPILRGPGGKPTTAGALSQLLIRTLAAVPEMPARSWHGLRYLAAGKLEESGCTVIQITSVLGHRTYQMAIQYMRQRRDAQAAIAQLEAAG